MSAVGERGRPNRRCLGLRTTFGQGSKTAGDCSKRDPWHFLYKSLPEV